jgi:hypothetical protein
MSRVRVLVAAGAAVASAGLLAVLMADHTIGGEIDGVIVAGIAVVTGIAGVVSLVRGGTRRRWVLAAWLVVAAGGVMGYLDHDAPPHPGRPILDERPRPPLAPLVFTVIGLAGAATLVRLPALRPGAGSQVEA